jgi:hypothetical protein
MRNVPKEIASPLNRRVLACLENASAHSDIAGVLQTAVKPLGDVQVYCPDWQRYRYVAVATKGIIFGFAAGTSTIAFRLDEKMKPRAMDTGGIALTQCGPEWVAVEHERPDSDWPAVDVRFWAQKAYFYAREG